MRRPHPRRSRSGRVAAPRALLAGLAALALAGCASGGGGATVDPVPSRCTFTNPITEGADPWVIRDGSAYYYVSSEGDGIWVYRSDSLTAPKENGVRVWTRPDTGWARHNVWAPELHRVGDRWYIYFAASEADGSPFLGQRAGVIESVGSDPQGAYVSRGRLLTGDSLVAGSEVWAIDMTVGDIGGQLYAVWSGWLGPASTDRTPQHLYIARMSNPWTLATARVRLSSPDAPWEVGSELSLQEGPELLQHGGSTFIIYSTRESWLREYRLGQLRLTSGADPLVPASWTKSGPVFQGTSTVYGTGHASFTTSPDGSEDWIVYHSKISTTPGWDRVVRMQKFGWKADGSPDFGVPVPSGRRVADPSGQCR